MNELEHEIAQMLLAGDHALLTILRRQLEVVELESREFSGVGFFTYLRVPASAPRLEGRPRLVIGDVYAKLSGLDHEVGFLLFISDGALNMLECFIHDDQWPTSPPALLRAYYVHTREDSCQIMETPQRDLGWALGHA
jgi:hypothetical protein